MVRRASELFGYTVRATDGEVGQLDDLYLDEKSWGVQFLAVETGPWLLGRRVLVRPPEAEQPLTEERVIPVAASVEDVKGSPPVDLAKPVSEQERAQLLEYWGWPSGLAESPVVQRLPVDEAHVARQQHRADRERVRSGLRSVREMIGYGIRARDDVEFGRVEDFCLTTEDWVIRYLMIDTRAWRAGRRVLVAPSWLEEVNWREQVLVVGLTEQQIESSPAFDPAKPITREYESGLYRHYSQQGYWG